jgi:hypothetical protein
MTRLAGVLLVTLVAWGVNYSATSADTAANVLGLSPQEAEAARHTIVAWLECEECTSGELKAVVALGTVAVPTLAAVLREGPSPASLETYRLRLLQAYDEMAAYLKKRPNEKPLTLSKQQYVDVYFSNYIALHKVRAAEGLARIGGTASRKALDVAKDDPNRDDVRGAIRKALSEVR